MCATQYIVYNKLKLLQKTTLYVQAMPCHAERTVSI